MPQIISDQRIIEMIAEPKRLPQDWQRQLETLRGKLSSKEATVAVHGADGTQFRIIVRQSRQNRQDFSVVLLVETELTPDFHLLRYDGGSHRHTNPMEGSRISFHPHIHRATARYQRAAAAERAASGQRRKYRHDGFAFAVERFRDLTGAWDCFFDDVKLELPAGHSARALPQALTF